MAESVEVATGYVTLVASAKGIRESIAQELGAPLQRAGEQGGHGQLPGVAGGHRHGAGQQEDGEPAGQGDGDAGGEVAAEPGVALGAHGSNR